MNGFLIFSVFVIVSMWMLWWTAEKHWEHRNKGDALNLISGTARVVFAMFFLAFFLLMVALAFVCFKISWTLMIVPGSIAILLSIPLYKAFAGKLYW